MLLRCNINAFEKRRNEHCKQKNMNTLRFLSFFYLNSIAFNLQHVDYINPKFYLPIAFRQQSKNEYKRT